MVELYMMVFIYVFSNIISYYKFSGVEFILGVFKVLLLN